MQNKKILLIGSTGILTLLTFPRFAFAQVWDDNFANAVCYLISILDMILILLSSVAFFVFLWGIGQYVFKADQEAAREKGKFIMTWGVVALFVLVSIWGILQLLYGGFGFVDNFGTFLLRTGGGQPPVCSGWF